MEKTVRKRIVKNTGILSSLFLTACMVCPVNAQDPAEADPKPKTYMPVVIEEDFQTTMEKDVKAKPNVMERQKKTFGKAL